MHKEELVARVAKETDLQKKVVNSVVEEFARHTVQSVSRGETISLAHFGAFEAIIEPPAKRRPFFAADGDLSNVPVEVDAGSIQVVAAATAQEAPVVTQILSRALTIIKTVLLNGSRVTIEDFGTFEMGTAPSRTLVDPDTNEKFVAKQQARMRFRAGKLFSDLVLKTIPAHLS